MGSGNRIELLLLTLSISSPESKADAAAGVAALEKIEVAFAASLPAVAVGHRWMELLPGGLRGVFAGGTPLEMERLLDRREEGRRRGEKGEEERDVAASSGLAGGALRERRKIKRAATLFFRRRRINCLRVLGSLV
ncbi:hypothetical protein H5410_005994 [Solanum commersonii]|uniref:Uncharacterized protein n=1 Tax=Solanum commersonii TaxID=4109 RepID=A0A9J6A8M7_SOLCO|nr:hypothetical protein H5410_005994 [Solanum commersonii]